MTRLETHQRWIGEREHGSGTPQYLADYVGRAGPLLDGDLPVALYAVPAAARDEQRSPHLQVLAQVARLYRRDVAAAAQADQPNAIGVGPQHGSASMGARGGPENGETERFELDCESLEVV
jgi:hypothetical protein